MLAWRLTPVTADSWKAEARGTLDWRLTEHDILTCVKYNCTVGPTRSWAPPTTPRVQQPLRSDWIRNTPLLWLCPHGGSLSVWLIPRRLSTCLQGVPSCSDHAPPILAPPYVTLLFHPDLTLSLLPCQTAFCSPDIPSTTGSAMPHLTWITPA